MTIVKLFETEADLRRFVFRITDNGGESADRFTVATNDGDYFAMSTNPSHPQGVGLSGEGYDVVAMGSRVASGVERDIRWIDLPEACRRCVMNGLNVGFSDWLSEFAPPGLRSEAVANGSSGDRHRMTGEGVYGIPGEYRVRTENGDLDVEDDLGPYETIREAVLASLPDRHLMSPDELQATVDIWSVEGGPSPLWDREIDPPVLDQDDEHADFVLKHGKHHEVAWFASQDDARAHLDRLERNHYQSDEPGEFERSGYIVRDATTIAHSTV